MIELSRNVLRGLSNLATVCKNVEFLWNVTNSENWENVLLFVC